MSIETAAVMAASQEAGMDTTRDDVPSFLTSEPETGNVVSLDDQLSSSESPEPREENSVSGNAAAKALQGAGLNGSVSTAATDSKSILAMKTKKKEDKSIEYILRALSSLNSPEEKLAALCKKYADLHEEHRILQASFKSQQRKMTTGQREKDQLQAEHTKAVMAKSKLESLCRELQKQNKLIKEESILRQREEEEKRKEISAKFQTTIVEIQTQMTENHEKNVKLREENQEMVVKLKWFLEQEQLREQQLEKLTKHRELENQLAETKLAHAAAVLKEHVEKTTKEKELILMQTAESQKKNALLEAQLNMYKERYEEFQGTINKSNDMFQKLKSEMDKMGKRIKKLEKEGAQWKAKWEASNKALLDLAEEKSRSDKEKQLLQTKIIKLESLCRALQVELHANKAPNTYPSATTDIAKDISAVSAVSVPTSTSSSTSTTATPPNTPEENTSRASPNPESAANLSPGQNGPISSASLSVPGPSLPTEAQCEGEGASVADVGSEVVSNCLEDSSIPDFLETMQQSDQAEALPSSVSDPPASTSQDHTA